MKRIPVDVSYFHVINCSVPPTTVLDRETKQPRADVNGEVLYSMELVGYGEEHAEVFVVKVPGTPPVGVKRGMPVKVVGLMALPWDRDGRHGVSFAADRIEPAAPAQPAQKAGAA